MGKKTIGIISHSFIVQNKQKKTPSKLETWELYLPGKGICEKPVAIIFKSESWNASSSKIREKTPKLTLNASIQYFIGGLIRAGRQKLTNNIVDWKEKGKLFLFAKITNCGEIQWHIQNAIITNKWIYLPISNSVKVPEFIEK